LCLRGGNVSANSTWNVTDTSYYLRGDVLVNVGVTLTINPDVIVKIGGDRSLFVDGALRALGTAADPIYFTSYRDDTIGGDTNGDGSSTLPGISDWTRIEFRDFSDDANSLIDYAIIRYGGQVGGTSASTYGAVELTSASPTIQNTVVSLNRFAGIATNTSAPTLICNSIMNNEYGLRNKTPNVKVVAESQWWGDPSGPYHPVMNPSGSGNAVTDGVDFIPWLTSSCVSPEPPPTKVYLPAILKDYP
jgi:hypothetical protein